MVRRLRIFTTAAITALTGSVLCLILCTAAFAEDSVKKRGKVIDFEDEVVEGMNKRPLDSLQQIADGDRRKRKPHLYRTRAGFRSETEETVRLIRFTP